MKIIKNIAIKVSLGFIVLVVASAIAALGYEQFNRLVAENKFAPEGEVSKVAGHNLHFLRSGSSAPTVIFESGLDPFGHLSWFKVENEINASATTLSYDRAGILWSERGRDDKSLESISADLTNLLESIDAPKPYIIVGHSAAGITLRRFISDHQDDIAGIVFVDASHPEQTVLRPPKLPPAYVMSLMNASGFIRFSSNRLMPNTSENDRINQLGRALTHKSINGPFDEAAAMKDMSTSAQKIDSFGDIPLIVISATRYRNTSISPSPDLVQIFESRERFQTDLLSLSSQSVQIEAKQSSHYIQLEEPEIVVSAIKTLISYSKTQSSDLCEMIFNRSGISCKNSNQDQ